MHRFILTRTAPALVAGAALALAVAAPAEAKPAPSPVRCASPAAAGDKPVVIPLPGGGKLYIFDRDGDKRPDGIVIDADGDGKMDAAASDCDRDGEFETFWVDENKDGVVDPAEVTRKKNRNNTSVRVGDTTCGAKVNLKHRGLRPRSVKLVCPGAPAPVDARRPDRVGRLDRARRAPDARRHHDARRYACARRQHQAACEARAD